MKIVLGLEYDGSHYLGWQLQAIPPTIQDVLEEAVLKIDEGEKKVPVFCSGRTDAGVHAIQQVVHFETTATRVMHAWQWGVNQHLPADIRVLWAQEVPTNFHARFSAFKRSYVYLIENKPQPSVFLHKKAYWFRRPLNVEHMQEAATSWLGEHDFSSFRASGCQATHAIRTVYNLNVTRQNECVVIRITANGFLYHMVRNMVGTLLKVGAGEHPIEWTKKVLVAQDRKQAGLTVPACGLYFLGAEYGAQFNIPCTPSLKFVG